MKVAATLRAFPRQAEAGPSRLRLQATLKEGFFWCAGQGGYGIQTAPAMGRVASAMARQAPMPRDIMEQGLTADMISPNHCFENVEPRRQVEAWRMASEPNNVGAPHDRENAEWERDQLKNFGWDAYIEEYQVL
jgi:hypothetical protein